MYGLTYFITPEGLRRIGESVNVPFCVPGSPMGSARSSGSSNASGRSGRRWVLILLPTFTPFSKELFVYFETFPGGHVILLNTVFWSWCDGLRSKCSDVLRIVSWTFMDLGGSQWKVLLYYGFFKILFWQCLVVSVYICVKLPICICFVMCLHETVL